MKNKKNTDFLEELYSIIKSRAESGNKTSYTRSLINKGRNKISQKVGEESVELIVDYLNGSKKRTIEEAADLIYHFLVLLYSKKITINDIRKELNKRRNVRR